MTNLWDLYCFTYDSLKVLPSYRIMIQRVIEALDVKAGKKYLDLGCGTGNLVAEMVKKYGHLAVYGLDFSAASLLIANKKLKNLSTTSRSYLFLYDVRRNLPFPSEYFDGVSLVQLVNYLPTFNDVIKLMIEVDRVTNKSGKIVIVSVAKKPEFMKGSSDFKQALKEYPFKSIRNLPFLIANAIFNLPMRLGKNLSLYNERVLEKIGRILNWEKEYSENLYYNNINVLIKFRKSY